jgi:predicted acylesterase/phospholipase RssA
MEGGLTSGVVYPLALIQLAQRYTFRCIGGTSAGAIAAAIAAAAEHGRASGSFDRLQELPNELSRISSTCFSQHLPSAASSVRFSLRSITPPVR